MSGAFRMKTEKTEKIYTARKFELIRDTVKLEDGSKIIKEYLRHPGSVVIIPYDKGDLYLIKQYRYPTGEYLYEVPAGTIEKGENPEDCALRELKEETGLDASYIQELFSAYLVPGYSNEKAHFYLATGLKMGKMNPEKGEEITLIRTTMSEALKMVDKGLIRDAKTLLAILWLTFMLDIA